MNDFLSPGFHSARDLTRRHFFQTSGLGFGAMALNALIGGDAAAKAGESRGPMLPPRAKRVIYLHMAGSPSQLETFDYKPELQKLHLQDAPASFLEGKRFAFIKGVPKVLAGQFSFSQQGRSGQWVSELLPRFAKVIDKASSKLFYHCCSGKHFPDAMLTFRKAGGEQEEYFQVKLTDLMVSSITWSDHAGGGSLAQEQGSLSFTKVEFIYKMQGQDGKLQGQVRADWDVKANKGST